MNIHVDASAVSKFTERLKTLHRSAFPIAVRDTLNSAAFDMKQNTVLQNSRKQFINRQPNFFKANSSVDKAAGFNMSNMKATMGMTEGKLQGDDNFSVKDLQQQEFGGNIKKKAFIPMLGARSGGARSLVRPNARLQKIKNIVKASSMGFSNPKSNFIVAAHRAGKGGYFLSKKTLWRVNSLNPVKSSDLNLTPLYSFKAGRTARIKPHHFIEKSGLQSGSKMDDYYAMHAQRQFEKHLRVR